MPRGDGDGLIAPALGGKSRSAPRAAALRLVDAAYLTLALLAGPPWLGYRLLRGKAVASPWRRLGFVEPVPGAASPVVWIHAVSVGETLAARKLAEGLATRYPGGRIVHTATTPTGLAVARASFDPRPVREAPYDLSGSVRRFLRRVRPDLLVLMEAELWPNLLRLCAASSIPVAVVNARISERSLAGYRRLQKLLRGVFDPVRLWCAQDALQAGRLRGLGVSEERIRLTGNLKHDNVELRDPAELREQLRGAHGYRPGARVVLGGSTHGGEEEALLRVARRIWPRCPELRLVLAPRHPERLPGVISLCERSGLRVGLRSRPAACPDPEILVVDTLGELATLYAMADVAFVGGTLAAAGGHNLLEPAGFGIPTVVGPHVASVRETAALLEAAGSLAVVRAETECEMVLTRLLDDPGAGARAAAGARQVIEASRGAVERTLAGLADLLEENQGV